MKVILKSLISSLFWYLVGYLCGTDCTYTFGSERDLVGVFGLSFSSKLISLNVVLFILVLADVSILSVKFLKSNFSLLSFITFNTWHTTRTMSTDSKAARLVPKEAEMEEKTGYMG